MTTRRSPTSHHDPLQAWRAGDLAAPAAIRRLWDELRQVEAARQELDVRRDGLRDQLHAIVAQLGGAFRLAGYGKLEILPASTSTSYVKAQVDELVIALTSEQPALAARLAACRKEAQRAGGLRVTPEKPVRT